MKCIIPGPSAIVLAKAIQSFARIGSDLFIEAQPDGLSIRTVNKVCSAFALMVFHRDFFDSYDLAPSTDDEYENKCKISMKSCLGVFKNMKQVEQCQLSLDPVNYKLKIQLKCRLETIKTHYVTILEQESLQAVYTTDNVPNTLTGSHKLFDDIVSNFQSNEEELTFEASKSEIVVKNYVEGSDVDKRYMRSQLKLKPEEFDGYRITAETSITFSLRELKAILNFADALSLDVTMNFETTGSPVVFVLRNADALEANLVMSTLASEDIDPGGDTTTGKQPRKTTTKSVTGNETNYSIRNTSNVNESLATPDDPALFNFSRRPKPTITAKPVATSSGLPETLSLSILSVRPISNVVLDNSNTTTMSGTANVPPLRLQPPLESEEVTVHFTEESDDPMAGPILKTKCRADLKHIFRRCFESQPFHSSRPNESQILAESSDPEDAF